MFAELDPSRARRVVILYQDFWPTYGKLESLTSKHWRMLPTGQTQLSLVGKIDPLLFESEALILLEISADERPKPPHGAIILAQRKHGDWVIDRKGFSHRFERFALISGTANPKEFPRPISEFFKKGRWIEVYNLTRKIGAGAFLGEAPFGLAIFINDPTNTGPAVHSAFDLHWLTIERSIDGLIPGDEVSFVFGNYSLEVRVEKLTDAGAFVRPTNGSLGYLMIPRSFETKDRPTITEHFRFAN